jgi:hypothetical protein
MACPSLVLSSLARPRHSQMAQAFLCMCAGSSDQLAAADGGQLFLGATVCVGDMQRLREKAKKKRPHRTLTINAQTFEHAFYNALQASGGAVDAVRIATQLYLWTRHQDGCTCTDV